MEESKCCVCQNALENIVSCPKCLAAQHKECADFVSQAAAPTGSCGTFGCDGGHVSVDSHVPASESVMLVQSKSEKNIVGVESYEAAFRRIKEGLCSWLGSMWWGSYHPLVWDIGGYLGVAKVAELVVKDLLILGRYDDALAVAKQKSPDAPDLLKKTSFTVGSVYARKGESYKSWESFFDGGHYDRALDVGLVQNCVDRFEDIYNKHSSVIGDPKAVEKARLAKKFEQIIEPRGVIITPKMYATDIREWVPDHKSSRPACLAYSKKSKGLYIKARRWLESEGRFTDLLVLAKEFNDQSTLTKYQKILGNASESVGLLEESKEKKYTTEL